MKKPFSLMYCLGALSIVWAGSCARTDRPAAEVATTQEAVVVVDAAAAQSQATQPQPSQVQIPPIDPEFRRSKLAKELHAVLHRLDHTGATVAARVVELDGGDVLYASDAAKPVIPASNMKVPVSAAFLATFGASHTLKTHLAVCDNGDIYLIGTGDPSVADERVAELKGEQQFAIFDQFAAALKEAGISNITGTVHYFDGSFDDVLIHPRWSKDHRKYWYGAPVSGLNLNTNCIDVKVTPGEAGQPATYSVTPVGSGVGILNQTTSASPATTQASASTQPYAAEDDTRTPAINRQGDEEIYVLSGVVTEPTTLPSKPVVEPGAFFARTFVSAMKERGIDVTGTIKRLPPARSTPVFAPNEQLVPLPECAKIVSTYETPLPMVLRRINKNSQNLMAEAAAKLVGQEMMARKGYRGPGSWEAADEGIREFLTSNDIDATGFTLQDGSGLGRLNKVTAKMMTELLVAMSRRGDWKVFRNSLAVPGSEGTLGRRLTELEGRVWAKTGYINGVRALSGYIKRKNGSYVAFSFIYNDIPGSVRPYEQLQDEAIRLLYKSR